ncbi:MAG: PHP domain-containing protein [Oscillospiraceae bacterium]|nr:PHP domain-containing protein [Oscillospiraceae bacterium]
MDNGLFIDLHMHSAFSDDGEFSPEQLVERCAAAGVRIAALSDHNCVRGVARMKKAADAAGMRCIAAAEFDCVFGDVPLHMLGYGIDAENPAYARAEQNILAQELANASEKLRLTQALGFSVDKAALDALAPGGVYAGEMFAEVLLKDARYAHSALLAPYRAGGARGDNPYVNFYWDFYAQGKPCYTEMVYPSLADTIGMIHSDGGLAVLAHPGVNLKKSPALFEEIADAGIDGAEAFSSYHTRETSEFYYVRAQRRGLLVTCGSDFHGKTKPSIAPGGSGCFIDEHTIEEQLLQRGLL